MRTQTEMRNKEPEQTINQLMRDLCGVQSSIVYKCPVSFVQNKLAYYPNTFLVQKIFMKFDHGNCSTVVTNTL